MTNFNIEQLDWDSRFFGYPVGKLDLYTVGEMDEEELNDQLHTSPFHLLYIFSNPSNNDLENKIMNSGAIAVDQRIILTKKTACHQNALNAISEYHPAVVSAELKKLALASGRFSRFNTDPNFLNNEYERLYSEWITRSVKKEIASHVYVAKYESLITGMVTLALKNETATIGLISVVERHQGKKIGTDLVHIADTAAFNMGFKTLTVTTQRKNEMAVCLYQKCGFAIAEKINIYHFWNKR